MLHSLSCSFTEVRKEACFILGLLAVKPEYQHQIATAQALPGLVKLLQVRLRLQMLPCQTALGCCMLHESAAVHCGQCL